MLMMMMMHDIYFFMSEFEIGFFSLLWIV